MCSMRTISCARNGRLHQMQGQRETRWYHWLGNSSDDSTLSIIFLFSVPLWKEREEAETEAEAEAEAAEAEAEAEAEKFKEEY